ncbi:mitochondrial Rho GTPase 3 isoform X2 [Brassica napus]|nr:mitochondrial Rho GTPase 3 isoform X2 [Brassica napus]
MTSGFGFGLGDSNGSTKPVRIVVVGEKETRKTSLIMAAVTDHYYPEPNIPSLLPYTKLPSEYCSEDVPVTLIDTSSRPEDKRDVIREVKEADAIVLTFAIDRQETLDRLSEYWLPLFRQLKVRVPIVVACYSVIKNEHNPVNIEEITLPIRQQCQEIEICIEWSAPWLSDISWLAQAVFVQAQISAMYPIGPVYDRVTNSLKPRCVAALKRIFELYARNNDYILSDDGLSDMNVRSFGIPVMPSRSRELIKSVQELCPLGVKENGLTIDGFLVLITKLINDRKLRTLWTILRKLGYNNDLRLVHEMIPYSSFKRMPDQSVELTDQAIGSLKRAYHRFDNLGPQMMESLFETAPESPWNGAPYKDATEKTSNGGLSLEAFLSLWSLMTLLDPARSLEYFICICHPDDPSSAVHVTRRRELDRKEQISVRKVVQCFVFGPKNAGKSALLNGFIGRPYDDDNRDGLGEERYAVNMVGNSGITGGTKKTLVMKEIQYQKEGFLLSDEALASCDVAVFVYDSSDESSWKRAIYMVSEVATISEDAGFVFPCLMVAAKMDLGSFPMAIQESTRATQDIGIEAPIPISSKLGNFDNLFHKILTAAEHPHLCIPKIESKRKRVLKLINSWIPECWVKCFCISS